MGGHGGAAVSCAHFLVELRAVVAEAERAGEGRGTIYAKMGGLSCFPNRKHKRVLLMSHNFYEYRHQVG